jgi:parallel beta-helix repeat protein
MMRASSWIVFLISFLCFPSCGKEESPLCVPREGGRCLEVKPEGDVTERLREIMTTLQPNDTLYLHEGSYNLKSSLYLDTPGVTIRGAGKTKTILSFAGMETGAGTDGLHITADNITLEDFSVLDMRGDGVKIEGGRNIVVRRVRAGWSGGPSSQNGGYGIYPVLCTGVLIEESEAFGASDTGIYVGQSENVVIRNNLAYENVAGIEVENSRYVDVYGNESRNNTGGILVFSLPNLQVKDAGYVRVFNNYIHDNNTDNFAPEGNIVGLVPRGTGLIIMAAHDVHVYNNRLENHKTGQIGIISYLLTMRPVSDPGYYPYPSTIFIHDNTFQAGGNEPDLGSLLGLALSTAFPNGVPDILYDGIRDPAVGNPRICIEEPQATFANWNVDPDRIRETAPDPSRVTTSRDPHNCTIPEPGPASYTAP